MTCWKSQGLTLKNVVLDLGKYEKPGYTFVGLSRVPSLKNIFVQSFGQSRFNQLKKGKIQLRLEEETRLKTLESNVTNMVNCADLIPPPPPHYSIRPSLPPSGPPPAPPHDHILVTQFDLSDSSIFSDGDIDSTPLNPPYQNISEMELDLSDVRFFATTSPPDPPQTTPPIEPPSILPDAPPLVSDDSVLLSQFTL